MTRLAVRRARRYCCLLSVLCLLGAGGCTGQVGGELLRSKKQRDTAPNVSQSEQRQLVAGNTEFTFELYHALRRENGNLFCSPWSISTALAMTYAGARGRTERQMAKTLHFSLPQRQLHPAFNALEAALASRAEDTGEPGEEGFKLEAFKLHVVNSIWGQKGHRFLPQFLDVLAVNYGAGLQLLDFARAPEPSRAAINRWVTRETEGKIRDVLPEGSVDTQTVLVLTDAIYFKAKWDCPFKEKDTRAGAFHPLRGRDITVDMMWQTEEFKYAEGRDYQAVELPYRGKKISMIVFLPRQGMFRTFEGSLNSGRVKAIVDRLAPRSVWLTMPKFRYESAFTLKKVLSEMGMPDAFGCADFSGIGGGLFIRDVYHKAFVAVDEEGTEAAAATAVPLQGRASREIEFKVDRPFIFMIRDIKTGAILFLGRVLNPKA